MIDDSLPLSIDRCDPGCMIRGALMAGEMICSEDVFVLWAMRLPPEIDTADAAALLLHAYPDFETEGPAQRRLRDLLAEASLFHLMNHKASSAGISPGRRLM